MDIKTRPWLSVLLMIAVVHCAKLLPKGGSQHNVLNTELIEKYIKYAYGNKNRSDSIGFNDNINTMALQRNGMNIPNGQRRPRKRYKPENEVHLFPHFVEPKQFEKSEDGRFDAVKNFIAHFQDKTQIPFSDSETLASQNNGRYFLFKTDSSDQMSKRENAVGLSQERNRVTNNYDPISNIKYLDGADNESTLASITKRNSAGEIVPCVMDRIEIDMRFREHSETDAGHPYLLECVGKVAVNKCEGMCESSVTPSVNHYDGFERVCACCKDISLSRRSVTLTDCVIGENEVRGYSLTRSIAEPASCSCQACNRN